MKALAIVAAIALFASQLMAEPISYVPDDYYAGISKVEIILHDDVPGGCWTEITSLKTELHKLLLQAGFEVSTEKDLSADVILFVNAAGLAPEQGSERLGCFGVLDLDIRQIGPVTTRPNWRPDTRLDYTWFFLLKESAIYSRGENLNDAFRTQSRDFVNSFIVKVLSADRQQKNQ